MDQDGGIDDSLYSRQRYVLGDGAMEKLGKADVLIIGLGGVGVEVAKNVILAGVKSVTLQDNKISQPCDLGTQFFLRQQDIDLKLPRGVACCKRLSELNPYVKVTHTEEDVTTNLQLLKQYHCIVVSELQFTEQIIVNNFCRSQQPAIPFISCDVIGVVSCLFCDFGDEFEVLDADGEEPKEIFIQSISKADPCIVKTLENRRHGLATDNLVMFKEIKGMTELNSHTYKITYIDPFSFSIDCNTTIDKYKPYNNGGMFVRAKEKSIVKFKSLESQLKSPDILINDLSKLDAPMQVLIALITLQKFKLQTDSCVSDNMNLYMQIAQSVVDSFDSPVASKLDVDFVRRIALASNGVLAPLCATVGGVAAQEVLKAISRKFHPLQQWLLSDAVELAADSNLNNCDDVGRYSVLRGCVGEELLNRLKSLKLFMVGCGAIGCEMLKNFALIGIGSNPDGLITITDNDLIEKSNLNRQFLFRPWHIEKPKSVTAAQSALEINSDLHILPQQNKVCPESQTIYSDHFFMPLDVVVNALDNVEARRYVDGRCVSNQKPLIETGTMGSKGHVQVIVPFHTESYSNQRDPAEEDVPYCTLKSFPQVIEHTIQWARDKFESLFTLKPTEYNKFWQAHVNPSTLCDGSSDTGGSVKIPDGFVNAVRLLQSKPYDWKDCVALGRIKFELYFNHKAKQLLSSFPLDSTLSDGGLFWKSPKRPPNPVVFDIGSDMHMQFIVSYARILARVNIINVTGEDVQCENVTKIIQHVVVPQFLPSNKNINFENNEEATSKGEEDSDKISKLTRFLKLADLQTCTEVDQFLPEHFEKDDDGNGHINFITAASNLRAMMYNIEPADRYKTKRVAGHIIPAIATTTATIAGLATIELIKVAARQPIENLKNCFLNLALPLVVLSEPGPAPKTKIRDDVEFSLWDRWDVHGNKNFKLKDFINYFKNKYSLNVSMVCEGVRMIYVPIMPGHSKRVNDLMTKLLKPKKNTAYVDLVICFESQHEEEDDLAAPPIRYFYNSQ